jgi:indolepyruvate ferredoxin oxidoreductase alpha subunit
VEVCKACGVEHVRVADPWDLKETEKVLKEELAREETSVILFRRECILLNRWKPVKRLAHHADKCVGCGRCLSLGCPVLERVQEGKKKRPRINAAMCVHCGLCAQLCNAGALEMEGV